LFHAVHWSVSAPVLWRCVLKWSSPLANLEAATATLSGTFLATMGRLHDLSALKCWRCVWRLCHYGLDAVFDGSEPRLDPALFPYFQGQWLMSEALQLNTPLWSETIVKENPSPRPAGGQLLDMCWHSLCRHRERSLVEGEQYANNWNANFCVTDYISSLV
jgi:hypothetical protein